MGRHTLYSYRRCPYAMRARMALAVAGIPVEIIEISLRDKPAALLTLSPKGTVPVLHLSSGEVIEQSLDIMAWALAQHDPAGWLQLDAQGKQDNQSLIEACDQGFKPLLDAYKYPQREHACLAGLGLDDVASTQAGASSLTIARAQAARAAGAALLQTWEDRLQHQLYLLAQEPKMADYALMPFVRQFAKVDPDWFAAQPWPKLQQWLERLSSSRLFVYIMQKNLDRLVFKLGKP